MKTKTINKIVDIINKNSRIRPHELVEMLNITPAAIHRHLKKLISENKIKKVGKPPLVSALYDCSLCCV